MKANGAGESNKRDIWSRLEGRWTICRIPEFGMVTYVVDDVASRSSAGPVGAYFKPARGLHRPLCETVGYARRAAANSLTLAPPEGKVERAAVVWPRAPSLHAP